MSAVACIGGGGILGMYSDSIVWFRACALVVVVVVRRQFRRGVTDRSREEKAGGFLFLDKIS